MKRPHQFLSEESQEGMMEIAPQEETYPDITQIAKRYQGQSVCSMCGHDNEGQWWPNCADAAHLYTISAAQAHPHTCEVYWNYSTTLSTLWLCDECEYALQ